MDNPITESNLPRILFVSHCAQLSGAEFILFDIAHSFRSNSQVFLFEDGPLRLHMEAAGISTTIGHRLTDLFSVRRDSKPTMNLPVLGAISRATLQLSRMARRHQLVYAGSQKAFVTAALASPLARRPLIWHLQDIMTRDHFGAKQIAVAINLANKVAARVIVPTRAVAEAFCAAGGKSSIIRVVPNGVSVPTETRSLDRDKLRVELDLPSGFLISVVGRLARWKGQRVMLEALSLLPGAQCIIVGDAMFGEDAYAEELYRLVDVLRLGDRVRFLGRRADVARLMRASDIVVHTSVKPEPFGRVIIEAMLCGTPVAATRAGGVPEILSGGLGALLYPPGDSVALAELLQSFERGTYCRTRLVDQGIEHAERCFSVGRMQQDVNCIALEVLASNR